MPRSAAAAHYCAHIRAWFGLSLTERATYLGVSKQFIAKMEAGKRALPLAASTVLRPLLLALPAPEVRAAATALEAAEAAAAEAPPPCMRRPPGCPPGTRRFRHPPPARWSCAAAGAGRRPPSTGWTNCWTRWSWAWPT